MTGQFEPNISWQMCRSIKQTGSSVAKAFQNKDKSVKCVW